MIHGARVLPLMVLISACSVTSLGGRSSDNGKLVDSVKSADFAFGAMAIGQAKDVAYARAEGVGLVPAAAFEAYLNRVLAKLLSQSPLRNVPARVYVRAGDEWTAITTADANIYVGLGALLRLDSEDEVAALLAHEVSHVILGHADTDILQNTQQRALQLSTIALAVRDQVENGGKGGVVKAGADDARKKEQARALLLNTLVVGPAWNRGQEREADLLATDLLVRAGYPAAAMGALLRKQAEFESHREQDPQTQYFQAQLSNFGVDTPKLVDTKLDEVAQHAGPASQLTAGLMKEGFNQVMGWGAKQLDEAQRGHPKTEDRIADQQAYTAREYSGLASPVAQVEAWEAAKEESDTADLLENYIAAIDAQRQLFGNDLKAAGKLAKSSTMGVTRTHPFPNYIAAAVQVAQGNQQAAVASYETALSGAEPAGAIYVEASAFYLKAGKRDKAREIIESGYKRLQQPPGLALPLIRTYRALGKQSDADRVAAQCALWWPKLQAACNHEANDLSSSTKSP